MLRTIYEEKFFDNVLWNYFNWKYLVRLVMYALGKYTGCQHIILRGSRLLSAVLIVCLNISLSNLPVRAEVLAEEALSNTRPRVALAMGGGGTRGVAHLGVLRVLEREGIPIDCIAGTSIGAIIGGLYAAGMSLTDIENIFRTKSILHHFDTVPITVRLALIPVFFVPHIFGYHPYDGLYRGGIFAKFLSNLIAPDKRNLEDLKRPVFWAVASNLLDGMPYAIKSGNIGKALQASSALPALRRPVEIDHALLIDGGVLENLPVTQALKMGCDFVIAIDIDQAVPILPKQSFRKIGSVSFRALNMNLRALDQPQTKLADFVISPNLGNISLLSHSEADVTQAIRAGEEAAEKAMPALKAKLALLRSTK